MAGLYIHIPYCRRACSYCNFHFSTNLSHIQELLNAIHLELIAQKEVFANLEVTSIYLGGGTPSLLDKQDLEKLFDVIYKHYHIDDSAEVTLEANPEDLTPSYLDILFHSLPVNRLSIGIQSFLDDELKFMNRAHSAAQSFQVLTDVQRVGFNNYSADLIFGTPGSSLESWKSTLSTMLDFNVPHLSVYGLTVEEKTALHHWVQSQKVHQVDEDLFTQQFYAAIEMLESAGYEHYEISNYAKPGFRAAHNSSYWSRQPYLGIGPSAHSFTGHSRRWNIKNNIKYNKYISDGLPYYEEETLSKKEAYNELILTGLRTMEGVRLSDLRALSEKWTRETLRNSSAWESKNLLRIEDERIIITKAGKILSDRISSDLFTD